MALPYFYVASLLRKINILTLEFQSFKVIVFILICVFISYYTSQPDVDYMYSNFGENVIFLYISAFSGIGIIWGVAYLLKKLPYFSYVGRYSIIVLGTHAFFLRILMALDINKYFIAIIILLINPIVIWMLKKYFPYFTAQKDLFVCNECGQLKWTGPSVIYKYYLSIFRRKM